MGNYMRATSLLNRPPNRHAPMQTLSPTSSHSFYQWAATCNCSSAQEQSGPDWIKCESLFPVPCIQNRNGLVTVTNPAPVARLSVFQKVTQEVSGAWRGCGDGYFLYLLTDWPETGWTESGIIILS
jgi:hypothetical protein